MLVRTMYGSLSSKQIDEKQLQLFAEKAGLELVKKSSGRAYVFFLPSIIEGSPLHKQVTAAAKETRIELSVVSREPMPTEEEIANAFILSMNLPAYFDKVTATKTFCTLCPDSIDKLSAMKGPIKADLEKLSKFPFACADNALFLSDDIKRALEHHNVSGLRFWPCEDAKKRTFQSYYWAVSVEDRVDVLGSTEYLTVEEPLYTLAANSVELVRDLAVSKQLIDGYYPIFVRPKLRSILTQYNVHILDWQIPEIK